MTLWRQITLTRFALWYGENPIVDTFINASSHSKRIITLVVLCHSHHTTADKTLWPPGLFIPPNIRITHFHLYLLKAIQLFGVSYPHRLTPSHRRHKTMKTRAAARSQPTLLALKQYMFAWRLHCKNKQSRCRRIERTP